MVQGCSVAYRKQSLLLLLGASINVCTFVGCASAPKTAKPTTPPTSAAVGNNTTIVAIAPAPAAKSCTLPEFLGLPKIAGATGGILQRLGSRLLSGLDLTGRFPGLQPQPPVLPITDPANLDESAPPAVQAAAEIKQEEDAAPQKIMAIRYLATLGCGGCYPKVEDALLEGLSDCTESVRFEAVKALQCKPECGCNFCGSPSCCSMKVRKRLQELTTCEKEPSERIRRLARIALACCGTKPLQEEDVPREGPPGSASDANSIASSTLFEGIQLVRFDDASPAEAGDMVLATVNGEPIFESQVLPLVESKVRSSEVLNPNDPITRRKHLASELTKMIDWRLISQQSKNEVRLAATETSRTVLSPKEIQSWFERHIQFDTNVSTQEVIAYYEIHKEDFRTSERVRWERLTVKIQEGSDIETALAIANYLRNRSLRIDLEPPAEYSRDKIETQAYGWTELSTIKLESERSALKQLQPGQISNIIETIDGVHLVRLLERQAESLQPITAVFEPIRNAILADRRRAAELRLISTLRSQNQIWTVFDTPNVKSTSQTNGTKVVPTSTEQQ